MPSNRRRVYDASTKRAVRTRVAAEKNLMSSQDSFGLKSFEGKPMTPHEFRSQIRSVLNVKLNDEQLVAIVEYFDKDGDSTVDTKKSQI